MATSESIGDYGKLTGISTNVFTANIERDDLDYTSYVQYAQAMQAQRNLDSTTKLKQLEDHLLVLSVKWEKALQELVDQNRKQAVENETLRSEIAELRQDLRDLARQGQVSLDRVPRRMPILSI